ncbi:hypothetical protein B0H10DRAFT_479554 [Mycena sp. CBHHK59/15]|nr:hypothetical protein B0H10DRAFT_479554 [Mycena sp. CBHHK59/15]
MEQVSILRMNFYVSKAGSLKTRPVTDVTERVFLPFLLLSYFKYPQKMAASSQENGPPKPSLYAQKKAKKDVNGCRGQGVSDASQLSRHGRSKAKLSLLPLLPLDVLFEIFGHLPPLDILHLARTTKDLRRVLLHKSAISIWKASLRQALGFPECPPDMSEPAWVNLAYSPHCHNCLDSRVLKVDWFLRIRLCEPCIKTSGLLWSGQHLDKKIKSDKVLLRCVPFSATFRGVKRKCCLVEDKEMFCKAVAANKGNLSEYIKRTKKAMAIREEHALRCKKWLNSLTQGRIDELAGIRNQRSLDIADKLEKMGWIEELEYLENLEYEGPNSTLIMFNDHPDVKVNKPLTDRAWKNMEARMSHYMNQVKAHMLAADRLAVIRQREKLAVLAWVQFRMRFPAEDLLPSAVDVLSWGTVRAIVTLPSDVPTKERDGDVDPPSSELTKTAEDKEGLRIGGAEDRIKPTVISPASFTQVFESLSTFISQWQAKKMQELCRIHPADLSLRFSVYHPLDQLRTLRLAVCVFTCEDRSSIHRGMEHYQAGQYPSMWFPEFVHHPCNTMIPKHARNNKDEPWNPLFKASNPFSWCRRNEWSSGSLFFDEKASRAVKKILEACGLDYSKVTTQEMDDFDHRLICLKCSYGAKCDGQRPRTVMPWRNAVQHCMLVHWGDVAVTWEKITDESAAEARALSAARSIPSNIWRCGHCRESVFDRDGEKTEKSMENHLGRQHGIKDGLKGRDYYQAVDCPPPPIASVKIVPKEAS